MIVTTKVALAILSKHFDIATHNKYGDTIYIREIETARITFNFTENAKPTYFDENVSVYSIDSIEGFTIVDINTQEIIYGTRMLATSLPDPDKVSWIITSVPL